MRRFETFHPLPLLLYFLAIILSVMIFMEPYMILAALVTGIAAKIYFTRKFSGRSLVLYLLLVILVTVVNAICYRTGTQILFYWNGWGVSREGIYYGIRTGGMLVAALLWCECLSNVLTGDGVMSLLSGLPKFALLFTMIVRLIPRYIRRYREVQAADTVNGDGRSSERTNLVIRSSAVFTWALENAVQTADSMEMRGFGNRKRNPMRRSWYKRDTILTIVIVLCLAGFFRNRWIPMTILGLLPLVYAAKEEIRWAIYRKHNL